MSVRRAVMHHPEWRSKLSDWIEKDGKRYYEAGYLEMANATAKRRGEKIKELEIQIQNQAPIPSATDDEFDELRKDYEERGREFIETAKERDKLKTQLTEEQARSAALRDEVNRRRRRMDQTAIMLKDALNLISGRE